MLKTYRIIPSTFILFLFGLTLITVSSVSAQDSPEFMACKQIKPRGNFKLMKQKKNCFRDVARLFQVASVNSAVPPSDPSIDTQKFDATISALTARLDEIEKVYAQIRQEVDSQARQEQQPPATPRGPGIGDPGESDVQLIDAIIFIFDTLMHTDEVSRRVRDCMPGRINSATGKPYQYGPGHQERCDTMERHRRFIDNMRFQR